MATRKFSDNPVATLPLAGDEIIPCVQGAVDKRTTAFDIARATVPALRSRLHLHFNGTNGATETVTDSSPCGRNPVQFGAVSLSSTQVKFGATSLRIPNGTPLAYAPDEDLALANCDFTLSWWLYRLATGSVGVLSRRQAASATGWAIQTDRLRAEINGTWSENALTWTDPGTLAWHHFELARQGRNLRMFINGALAASRADVNFLTDRASISICFGQSDNATENRLDGYMDEFLWIKGRALHTAAFTPPTAPYPDL